MRSAETYALAVFALIGSIFVLVGSALAQSTVPPPPTEGPPTVEAQPPTTTVAATRSSSVPVTWILTNPGPDPIQAVNSPGATLFFAGPNGSGSLEITRPLIHGPIQPGQSARIPETMVIPQSFLTRVLQAGDRSISVERFFQIQFATGQTGSVEGQLEINITGSLGAGLQINRIDLRFQNEAVQIIVPQGHPPEVRVDVSYTGTGLFRAVWEVADPRVTAAGGPPIFRVLRQDRIRLGVGGLKRVKGPRLPAEITGLHVVRFRVLDGPLRGQAPVVRYFVKAAAPDEEDWWKRYIRPHEEGEGLVRVPVEPEDEEPAIEDVEVMEPEEDALPPDDTPEPGAPGASGDTGASPEEPTEENGGGENAEEPSTDDGAGEDTGDEEPAEENGAEDVPDAEEPGDEDGNQPEE